MKHKIFDILNFSTIISIEICLPLVDKIKNLELSKMAFQVVFSAKSVQRFSFGLLVAPKLKNQVKDIMAPSWSITSFQSLV